MLDKDLKTWLSSTAGVVVMLCIVLAVNFIAGHVMARIDLTQGKVYTLSDGTRAILARLDSPVRIRYYATRSAGVMPPQYRSYIQHVSDMLAEYKQAGGGKVLIEKYDPQPDSDAEDSARLDGVDGQALSSGERLYHGLAVSQLDQKSVLPFLSPERETLLEYDISRAIAAVSSPTRPVVGVMTALPIFGGMGHGPQPQGPWAFLSELRRDYTVKNLGLDIDQVDADVKVLLVIHPRDITDKAQFAIDQFVLRGGRLIAFLDPYAYFDQQRAPGNVMPFGRSTLPRLLQAWGVKLDEGKVVADMSFAASIGARTLPTLLTLTADAVDGKDIVTGQIQSMMLPFPGTFTGTPAKGLRQSVLLHSSRQAQLVDAVTAGPPGDQIAAAFKPDGTEHPLAIRLTGRFATAFPDGKPKDPPRTQPPGTPGDGSSSNSEAPVAAAAALKEGATENSVVLVADADLLSDEASVDVRDFLGQRILVPRNNNLSFVGNLVEQMAGDVNLISLRSRATFSRPFTVIKAMEAQAAQAYRGKIKAMEDDLAETRRKLGDLQRQKGGGQQFILSPEQQKEIDNFRNREGQVKRELKDLRKSLRRETDAVEFRTKVLNIAAMPVLVALAGIGLALIKRNRRAAR